MCMKTDRLTLLFLLLFDGEFDGQDKSRQRLAAVFQIIIISTKDQFLNLLDLLNEETTKS